MSFLTVFIVAISLSMDAFSLSLIYGTLNVSLAMMRRTSIVVGIFHFFMPLLGYLFGDLLSFFLSFNADFFVGIIFIVLAIQMFASLWKTEDVDLLTGLLSYFLFGFTVSVDSFSVGIGIGSLRGNIFVPCLVFSIVSFLFTYLGLRLGKRLALKFGRIATVFGSIMLFCLGFYYIL